MEAAVAMLAAIGQRFSLVQLKRAKDAGCPAFRGSRVYIDELVEWIDDNEDVLTVPTGDAELDAINKEIAREKLRKWKIENDNREGKSIPRTQVAARFSDYGAELLRLLRQKLEDESPRRLEGKTGDEIRAINREIVDEICDAMTRETDQWTKSATHG
ncbi:hypothetical protein OpiT1DRAFT_00190 [Opitutaceae bacterium TAV1]|nr:hypothetical protein OpiT1DRAFT_00190 [Opitutaceae bacterium TAV1]